MFKTNRISFGGTAAIVTSMALITGLNTAHAGKTAMVSALLIAAIADNLTDSLSVHMYQESERLEQREAFAGTISNFAVRLLVCLSFVFLVLILQEKNLTVGGIVWGLSLLAALTCLLARERRVSILSEVFKHLAVAVAVIAVSRLVGQWIARYVA